MQITTITSRMITRVEFQELQEVWDGPTQTQVARFAGETKNEELLYLNGFVVTLKRQWQVIRK